MIKFERPYIAMHLCINAKVTDWISTEVVRL